MTNIIPTLSKMSLKILNFEKTLFPALQEQLGVLSSKEEKLMRILELAQIELYVSEVKITNPPKHRKEIARAFIAKAVYNLQTTRDLIDRLKVDRVLRIICGWRYVRSIPSESTFSRVFAQLAHSKIADKTHQAFIKEYLSDTLFFYNSTDSTAIDVREKPLKKEKVPKVKQKRGRKRKDEPTPVVPKAPSLCLKQAEMNSTMHMLQEVSTSTDIGRKINAKGNGYAWIGGKLHLGVVDGDIPITAIYTCASVHDSQVAIPVINETTKRVDYLYDLCDKAYDSQPITAFSKKSGHTPIIDVNPRNCKETKIAIEGDKMLVKMGFNTPMSNHYNHRSSVERVNSYLKDSFGCKHIYVKGATKVASHLMFGVLALCIHQSIKLLT
ncbi:MAG: transposase [Sulfurospirillum sp.]|jgi:transposase|nr:transposase [Sulfurospirillum sp.]